MSASVLTGTAAAEPDPRNEGSHPSAPHESAIIDNGTIALGVNDEGHLNLFSERFRRDIGVFFIPELNESTAPGCLCEGWGAADATTGVTGFANISSDSGVNNMRLVSFEALPSVNPDRAVSVVDILAADGETAVLEVTHDFHPSTSDFLYEATVTIRNVSGAPVEPRYRRVMDWDVEPTAFSEIVTIDGSPSENLLFSSNDGFASADPLSGPSDLGQTGFFTDVGPDDHGALFDFGFPTLDPGQSRSFSIYYGAAPTENDALLAIDFVGATLWSLGQPNTETGATIGDPNTFVFAFRAVGGDVVSRVGVRKRADASRSEAGTENGYTVAFSNPTDAALSLTSITDELPDGFTYNEGTATFAGAPIADPTIDGNTLTFAGPFNLPPTSSSDLHFGVTIAPETPAGTYYNRATGTAEDGEGDPVAVRSTGPVAPIEVPPPTVATEVTPSTTTGSITVDEDTGIPTVSMARGRPSDLGLTAAVSCPEGEEVGDVVAVHGGNEFPMTETEPGSGIYTVVIPAASLVSGEPVNIRVECGGAPIVNVIAQIVLYDPSGFVTDAVTGDAIVGATVTLYKVPFALPDTAGETRDCRTIDTRGADDWSGQPPANLASGELADPDLLPAEIDPLVNPQLTNDIGRYGWNVAEGCWFVTVAASGYQTLVSPLVGVPPEVTDLDLALQPVSAPPVGGGDFFVPPPTTTPPPPDSVDPEGPRAEDPPPAAGYCLLLVTGTLQCFGGTAPGTTTPLRSELVDVASTPSGTGHWAVTAAGGVLTLGDAQFFGSLAGTPLNERIVGIATTRTGQGYWLVGADGGVFAFGDARFLGSMGGKPLNQPIVGIAADPDGHGYWLVAADGGVFAFEAPFFGSTGDMPLNQPVVGMAADSDGRGYRLVAADGGVFAFEAQFFGSTGGMELNEPIIGIVTDPSGAGYWLVAADGGVFAFNVPFFGSNPGRAGRVVGALPIPG